VFPLGTGSITNQASLMTVIPSQTTELSPLDILTNIGSSKTPGEYTGEIMAISNLLEIIIPVELLMNHGTQLFDKFLYDGVNNSNNIFFSNYICF